MIDDHPRPDGFGPAEDAVLGGPAPRYPEPEAEEVFPFLHVGLRCDREDGCDTTLSADVHATSLAEAMPALVTFGRQSGWSVTNDGQKAYCPEHWPVVPATLLGVPGEGEPDA